MRATPLTFLEGLLTELTLADREAIYANKAKCAEMNYREEHPPKEKQNAVIYVSWRLPTLAYRLLAAY